MKIKRKEYERQVAELRRLRRVAETRLRVHMVAGMPGEEIEAGPTLIDLQFDQLSLMSQFAHKPDDMLQLINGPIILMVIAPPEQTGYEQFIVSKFGDGGTES